MASERNALAELAERLKRRIEHHHYAYEIQRQDDVKAQLIVAELAKVKHFTGKSGMDEVDAYDSMNAVQECRAIAEE